MLSERLRGPEALHRMFRLVRQALLDLVLGLFGKVVDMKPHRLGGKRRECFLIVEVLRVSCVEVQIFHEPDHPHPRDVRAVSAHRRRRLLDQVDHLGERDVARHLGIEPSPRNLELLDVLVRNILSLLFPLLVAEVVHDNRNQKVERHESAEHDKRDEVRGRPLTAAALADGALARIVATAIRWGDHAVVHDRVPCLTGDHSQQ